MQVIIHRGTHQIGGVATEIRTASTRVLIDMGEELGLDENFIPAPLSIPYPETIDGVLITHNHGDHIGQLTALMPLTPIYMGAFSKEIALCTVRDNRHLADRLNSAKCFAPGKSFFIGDIKVTPFAIDHSALDSYMFLIEADGKRILHTGDFRLHGFRSKAMPKILTKLVGKVDLIITEGTALSRSAEVLVTEGQLQCMARDYMDKYEYVFVLCASTNLERICGLSKAVPRGKYFICDGYQVDLLELVEKHYGSYSPLYRHIKKTVYGSNKLEDFSRRGFLMMVRDNSKFRQIIKEFDPAKSIILYSMWDGYRTRPGSTLPEFLGLVPTWATLHTSGHASSSDLLKVINLADPDTVIPIHSNNPDALKALCPKRKVVILDDGEIWEV